MLSQKLTWGIALISALWLTGCSQSEPLTTDQKWEKFCQSYHAASYHIMADRQQGVSLDDALKHMESTPEGAEKQLLLGLIRAAHDTPKSDQRLEQEKIQEQFKAGKYERCMANQP